MNYETRTQSGSKIPWYASVRTKLTAALVLLVGLLSLVFYFNNTSSQAENLNETITARVNYVQTGFSNLEERDSKILASALEVIVQDPGIKQVYLEEDRDKLYAYARPLFEELKTKYGITHWYFISPSGETFLRIHNKDIYGDQINRFTFLKAQETKEVGAGIELGKTAYALRVVMPYYQDEKLIGYVELGEEIEHFLEILKGETNNEFVIIADKKNLDREDWKSVRQTAGLADNWDDSAEHLTIAATSKNKDANKCFTEENLERIENKEIVLDRVQIDNKFFNCGGFEIEDAGERHSGAVLGLINTDKQILAIQKANKKLIVLSVVIFGFTLILGVVITQKLSKPIRVLAKIAQSIAAGDLKKRAKIKSRDEAGQLAVSLNAMVDSLVKANESNRAVTQMLPEPLFVLNKDGKITSVNQAAENLLGYSKEEIVGKSIKEIWGGVS